VQEKPSAGWTQSIGRITEEILRAHLPSPGPETAVFLCGPPMMVDAVEELLKGLGYSDESLVLP
jgi:NAD(P)H-flavin reductase